MKKIAVLSLSGGLDSTCLLLDILTKGYDEVHIYSFDYGQKHHIELVMAGNNIDFLQKRFPIYWNIINVKDIFSESTSSLHQQGEAIPEGHYADENMKSTVVENRNVIFASIIYGKALSLSKKNDKCPVDIFLGVHAGDHTIYPDCRPESIQACATAFKISNWDSENIIYKTPFLNLTKTEVLRYGINSCWQLGMDIHEVNEMLKNTHTCYNPKGKKACGKCGSCTERLEAFRDNDLTDPAEYQEIS